MLPSLVARDIEKGLGSYIRNEFPIASRGFCDEEGKSVIEAFLEKPGNIAKGPWVEIKMPFREEADAVLPFAHLDLSKIFEGFRPYCHQKKAFERLAGAAPQSTIIATGTGSGKTECFLLPILDYCLAAAGKPGIKAILIYPMNALATDQEKRVRRLIEKIEAATGKRIRAGLYTGETKDDKRREFQKNPPDILLTNYKMLDFLLLRPADQDLWRGTGPGVLRYLAVDELHTFDGAQGTDLACLIRRLRDRLKLGDALACVGTSATIGGPASIESLCRYATSVFGTEITPEAVITEDRLSPAEYLKSFGDRAPVGYWPLSAEDLTGEKAGTAGTYFSQAVLAWFGETLGFATEGITDAAQVALGDALPGLEGFRRLVQDVQGVMSIDELARKWAREIPDMRAAAPDPIECEAFAKACAESLIAMISVARRKAGGRLLPLLNVRVQLWIRTLSRAVATVEEHPKLALAADLPSLSSPLALPIVSCRDCNQAAWATSIPGGPDKAGARVKPDLKLFYASWFSVHKDTALLYPVTDGAFYEAHRKRMYRICPGCGSIMSVMSRAWEALPKAGTEDAACPRCGSMNPVTVWIPDTTRTVKEDNTTVSKFANRCPHCESQGALRIFGAAASTLLAAAIDHLHSSPFAEDRKVIAFSDSVQDAAQRAGFLEARDFLPVCRHALVQHLKGLTAASDSVSLSALLTTISSAWQMKMAEGFDATPEGRAMADAAFLSTFMPPDKEWVHRWQVFSEAAQASTGFRKDGVRAVDVSRLLEKQADWKPLIPEVKERLAWEALMELGARSENGRTVLRTGAAAAFPNAALLRRAAERLLPDLSERFGIPAPKDAAEAKAFREDVTRYLAGLLQRFKLSGAFDIEQLPAKEFPNLVADFGGFVSGTVNDFKAFNLSRVLPTFGRIYRAPNAVTFRADKADHFNIPAATKGKTWFQHWTEKFFTRLNPLAPADDILRAAFDALAASRLLRGFERKRSGETIPAWVTPLASWSVTPRVRAWRCSCCRKRFFTAAESATEAVWEEMPCLTPSCQGKLEKADDRGYAGFYSSDPVRINAEEHTALVEADKRHAVEANFSTVREPWGVNLLSATPTLEMGIDIGDLSTVVLCSVPPSLSSFLQRIGRAGRRDGNAFALTMAGKSAHERYYWDAPRELLAGEIETPGVFLRAVSVLERQLFAFALGRWVTETSPRPQLPRTLKDAIAWHASDASDKRFPATFLAWAHDNAEELKSGFFRLFDREGAAEELTPAVREGLSLYLAGSGGRRSLARRLTEALDRAREQQESFQRKKRDIAKRIRTLLSQPQDPSTQSELSSLSEQDKAMASLLKSSFAGKLFFNFLTDEGLLPNYAFPEEGVQVHSVIVKRRKQADAKAGDAGQHKVSTFDFTRAAGPALRELAPESSFYAQRHVLRVDQLAVTDESFERWRFCPECGHAERSALESAPPSECPHCGCPGFGDSGRERTLIRTRELTAVADAKRDRIGDDREERRYEPCADHVLIDLDRKNVSDAWQVPDERFCFGFERLKKVTVREINFGPAFAGATNHFRAGGIDFPQLGFKLCRACGKVYRRSQAKKSAAKDASSELLIKHDFSCPYYGLPDDPDHPENSPWVDGLFLYRELESEAIRIRIPVCEMIDGEGADKGTYSLIAAIRLGLKRHFRGSVDHLMIALQTEPAKSASGTANRYIVIYDSIPGGSGYLKDLGQLDPRTGKPVQMLAMLRAALDAVTNCACAKDPEKDGCPHCVYQYRDFSPRETISRSAAQQILQKICAYDPEDIRTVSTVSDLPDFDGSVLEELFLKNLTAMKGAVSTRVPMKTGGDRYEISVPLSASAREAFRRRTGTNPGTRFTWRLSCQVDYRKATRPSRPDFLLEPASETLAARFPELQSYVFTDGWEYHAGILAEDAEKRQCILNDGRRVWSVAWQDLTKEKERKESSASDAADARLVKPSGDQQARELLGAFGKNPAEAKEEALRLLRADATNFGWLKAWLSDPFGFSEAMRSAVEYAALTQPSVQEIISRGDRRFPAPLFCQYEEGEPALFCADLDRTTFDFAACILPRPGNSPLISVALRADDAPFLKKDAERLTADCGLHEEWSAFWHSANAVQFLERSWICAASNERCAPCETWHQPPAAVPPTVSPLAEDDARWQEFIEELDSDPEFFAHTRSAAQALFAADAPAPSDLADGFGDTVCCEGQGILWEFGDRQVFLFPKEDLAQELPCGEPGNPAVYTTADPEWLAKLLPALNRLKEMN